MSSTQPSQWPLPGSYIQNVAPEPKSSEATEIGIAAKLCRRTGWTLLCFLTSDIPDGTAACSAREDADANEFEEEEPVFVLTDEWAEFFAKSEARRREKKKQLKKEAKKMQKAERLAQKQNSNEYKIPLFEEGKASETESVCLSNKSND